MSIYKRKRAKRKKRERERERETKEPKRQLDRVGGCKIGHRSKCADCWVDINVIKEIRVWKMASDRP